MCAPERPDIKDGRISLVIFFYPDADNLERQWQTINQEWGSPMYWFARYEAVTFQPFEQRLFYKNYQP